MTHDEAIALIRGGVAEPGETWADLGAGSGAFTRALADLLGERGVVHAVDRDVRVSELGGSQRPGWADIRAHRADFAEPLGLDALDGVLMANALHFVRDPRRVLRRVLGQLRPGGSFLVVEYDVDRGNPWIPHPVPRVRFEALASDVGLTSLREVGRTPSRFGHRDIYAVVGRKPTT